MKMLKRVAAGLMAAVMALGMLTACSSDKGTPQNWVDSTLAKMVANAAGSNSYVQSRSIAMTYTVVGGDGTENTWWVRTTIMAAQAMRALSVRWSTAGCPAVTSM